MISTYLVVLVLHVLCAALWVGVAVFSALFFMPAMKDVGPEGMKVMLALRKRGFVAYIPVVATVTVLSGFWLYWRFTAGFSAEVSRSHAGMAFGLGGACGLLALIIGGAVLSRSAALAMQLSTEAAKLPEGREKSDRIARAGALRQRAAAAGLVVAVLVVVTVILMVIARNI